MRLLRRITLLTSIIPVRKYTIVEPGLRGSPDFKPLLLTFDDGPNHVDSVTIELLGVLKKHNVKVCFCLIGKNVKEHPHVVKMIYDDGHVLGNHGYSEKPMIFHSNKALPIDIQECNKIILKAIGQPDHYIEYFRPGYGAYFPKHKLMWEKLNMKLLPVTDFYFDHKVDLSAMEKYILHFFKNVRKNNGGIYVMHDGRNVHSKIAAKVALAKTLNKHSDFDRRWVPSAIDRIITEFKADGFTFPPLNEHPNRFDEMFRKFIHPE